MKRLIAVLLVFVLSLSFAACGKTGKDEKNTTTTAAQSTSAPADEKTTAKRADLSNVEPVTNADGDVVLTYPSSFFDENNPPSAELTDDQKAQGVKKAVVNEDGSLSLIIGGADYEQAKRSALDDIKKAFDAYPQQQPFIKKVMFNDDLTVINIQADREGYETSSSGFAIVWEVGLYGQLGQVAIGAQPDQLSVDVIVTDVDTGDVLEASHYPMDKDK